MSHLLSKTLLTVTICFKLDGRRDSNEVRSLLFLVHCVSLRWLMEEVHHGTVWSTVSPMPDTGGVVRVRVVAKCWNQDCRYEKLGETFFQSLHFFFFVMQWYYDDMGCILCWKPSAKGASRGPDGPSPTASALPMVRQRLCRSKKGSMTFSAPRGMPNATALIRCRTAACPLTWVTCESAMVGRAGTGLSKSL